MASASDVAGLVAGSYIDRLEIRTKASPPVVWTGAEITDSIMGRSATSEPQQDSAVLSWLQPTVILDSSVFGKTTWAPYGVADPEAYRRTQRDTLFLLFGGAAALFGLGYYLGKRRRKA